MAKQSSSFGVVKQVQTAFARKNRLATFIGMVLGGWVPVASFVIAHYDMPNTTHAHMAVSGSMVLGALVYSAKSVIEWATLAFANKWKAVGFVVLTEGTMVTSHVVWLSYAALFMLVAINGIKAGCQLTVKSIEA